MSPEAAFSNGMAYLGEEEHAVMLADAGVVFRLDLKNRVSDITINDPPMKRCRPDILEGIDSLKIYGSELWFTRGYCGLLAKMPNFSNGTAVRPAEVVGVTPNSTWTLDDFVADPSGIAYVAVRFQNLVASCTPDGQWDVVAGNLNSSEIAEPTSVVFAKSPIGVMDYTRLYVTTRGSRRRSHQ
jgi:hypothetical protein